MSIALAALASAGGGMINAYGNFKSTLALAKGMERESLVKTATADEIRYRSKVNRGEIEKMGRIVKGEQLVQIAGSGRGLSSSTSFAILEQTSRDIATEVVNEMRQSEFEANIKELEARNLMEQGRQGRKAALIGLFGDLLSTGGRTKSAMPGGTGRG